jgi:hypothetical protein
MSIKYCRQGENLGYGDKADKEVIIPGLIERRKFTFQIIINMLK